MLRILCLNVWAHQIASSYGTQYNTVLSGKEYEKRLKIFIQYITSMKELDVICVQELFTWKLFRGCASEYYRDYVAKELMAIGTRNR